MFALATLPYVNGLRNGFTFDDLSLAAENQRLRSPAGVARVFTSDWWDGKTPQSLLYRPLTMASFAIDYAAGRSGETGPPPARLPDDAARPFHIQNLLWHGAACVAFYLLILELFARPGLALAAAALFAVHPVHTEAVNGIVGRAELMSACFTFFALVVAQRVFRDPSRSIAPAALAGALALAALLSKEQAIIVPFVPLLWLLPMTKKERNAKVRSKSFRNVTIALATATIVYLAMRGAALGSPFATGAIDHAPIVVDNPVKSATGAARLLTPLRVFGEALRVLVFPKTLSADYSYDQLPLIHSMDAATAGSAFILLALAGAVFVLRKRSPAASFGIGFFLLSFTLTSNIPIVIGTIFGERLLYLGSAGACLAVACGLIAAGKRFNLRNVATGAIAALVLLAAARTWARNADWKNNQTLFASAAAASPRSCKALDGYGSELLTAGRPKDALPWAERALAIYPSYPGAHQTLAKSLRAIANDEQDPARKAELRAKATEHAQALIAIYSASIGSAEGLADAWNVLGGLALDQGHVDDAVTNYRKSLELAPAFVPAVVGLGAALEAQAERASGTQTAEQLRDAATKQFNQAVALDPGNVEARRNAELLRGATTGDAAATANMHGLSGTRLLQEKRFAEAVAEFREAAKLQPQAARGFLGLGSALVSQAGEETDAKQKAALIDEAIRSFEHALVLEPDNPGAHMNLGITYLNQRRDPAKVAEQFRAYLRLVPDAPQRAHMEETIRQMDALAARPARPLSIAR